MIRFRALVRRYHPGFSGKVRFISVFFLSFSLFWIVPQPGHTQASPGKEKKPLKNRSYRNSDYFVYSHELGVNVTNVLANLFSLSAQQDMGPFGLIYRHHKASMSWRTGMSFTYERNSTSEFINNVFQLRDLARTQSALRAGIEKHQPLGHRFMFSYGIDILGGISFENSDVSQSGSTGSTFFSATERTLSAGGGPFLRLDYKITDRMILSTESTLYGTYGRTTSRISINGSTTSDPPTSNTRILLILPQSLYFSVAF